MDAIDDYRSFLFNLKSFAEIDECKAQNGNCSHTCINNEGSYECKCRRGFILASDKHTCQGRDTICRWFYMLWYLCHMIIFMGPPPGPQKVPNLLDFLSSGCQTSIICHSKIVDYKGLL